MVPNWKSLCRLCAREDSTNTHINIHLENELKSAYGDAISKYFSIDINLDDWPQTICTRCHQFVSNFINFVHKTSKVQTMFAELLENHELDLEQLRSKYELDELCDVKFNIKDKKPNIGEFEFIGEDMLNCELIKIENIDDDKGNISDKEWQPEQEDDSSDEDESTVETSKCEESEERPKMKKRGRPRKTLKTLCCSSCQKQFSSYPRYACHMQREHGVTAVPLPYTCLECNKPFSSKKALNKHETTHQCLEQKPTACPYCDKEFKQNKLRSHIREIHVGEKSYVCDNCGKAYTTFGNLKEHKLTHSEERPFKCRYCEKCFKSRSRLKTHEDTHNETNYICTSCGLQLNTRRTLNMHMLVHSDQKQHKCDFCGNEYKRAKALKNHLILHTGLKPYRCNFCDKTYANASNCRSHKKKVHPIELAAMEAAGTKILNPNIPKLEQLRAVTSNKSVIIQEPMGSIVRLSKILESTDSIVSMADEMESLRDENRLTTPTPPKEEQTINRQQNSDILHNNMGYGHLQTS